MVGCGNDININKIITEQYFSLLLPLHVSVKKCGVNGSTIRDEYLIL